MKSSTVQINELRLRASGLTPELARLLGETVAKRLANLPIAADRSQRIPDVTLRVRSSATSSIERMADEISTKIRHRLS